MNEVYMDIPAVRNMAKSLGQISQFLTGVAKAMEMLSNSLKATAFIGLVGGYALAQVIDAIKPHIEKMADKLEEMDGDVVASVDAFERGDEQGATKFH